MRLKRRIRRIKRELERKPLPRPFEEMMQEIEGAPCAGCGREDFLPAMMGVWQTGAKRAIPYLLCQKCGSKFGNQELTIEIEKRVGIWISGSPN